MPMSWPVGHTPETAVEELKKATDAKFSTLAETMGWTTWMMHDV